METTIDEAKAAGTLIAILLADNPQPIMHQSALAEERINIEVLSVRILEENSSMISKKSTRHRLSAIVSS